jgi:hypothetical protein
MYAQQLLLPFSASNQSDTAITLVNLPLQLLVGQSVHQEVKTSLSNIPSQASQSIDR